MISYELFRNIIQLKGRYTRFDMFCQFRQGLTNKLVSLAHQLYFIIRLQKYLHFPKNINMQRLRCYVYGLNLTDHRNDA